MKAMLIAFAAIIVIAVGANQALLHMGYSSADRATSDAVRLGD